MARYYKRVLKGRGGVGTNSGQGSASPFRLSPLNKRLPRELKANLGKWLGIVALLVLTISLVAGFLMASSSMRHILGAVDEDYNVEDGRFTANFEVKDATLEKLEGLGVSLYQNYSYDSSLALACPGEDGAAAGDAVGEDGAAAGSPMTARVYKNRTEIDLPAYFEGAAPSNADEVALDRVFCSNHGVKVGDTVELDGRAFVLSGIMSLSDHQAMFENNTDFVFNAQTFSVAQVSEEGFARLRGGNIAYTYSFLLKDRTLDDAQRVDFEEDMLDVLEDEGVALSDFLDRDANQAIGYASNDLEGDSVMWMAFLYLLIVILAFVFVVLTSATIEEESAVVGTLLALGYRKSEIIRHYLALPLLSGVVGAVLGNVLGLAFVIEKMSGLYYNSYSLPPYHTIWDWSVFAQSTLLPLAILVVVTLVGLMRKLRCTPLQFLRRETSRHGRKGGVKLPSALGFGARFRLRVFTRNISHFATLFLGIVFASLLLLFGFCMLPTINNYADFLSESLVSQHAYTLKAPVELEGTADERAMYAAALKLAETVDMSDIDKDAVEKKFSDLMEKRVRDSVEGQVENLFSKPALERVVKQKVKKLFDAKKLKAIVAGKVHFDASEEKLAELAAAGFDLSKLQGASVSSLSRGDLKVLVKHKVVYPRYVSLSEYGLGKVDILSKGSGSLSNVNASKLKWKRLVKDGIMRSSVIDLSYYGLGKINLARTSDLKKHFEGLDADNLKWNRLVNAGILRSSKIDLSKFGLGIVDLATFDKNDISVDDIDFDTMDLSDIKLKDVGLGSLKLDGMSKREFFKLMQKVSDIDEDAHVVNSVKNGKKALAQAEKFVAAGLQFNRGNDAGWEDVSLYGIQSDSRYYKDLELANDKVTLGMGLMEKFHLQVGDTIELYNKFEGETYRLTIGATWGNAGNTYAYMPFDAANKLLGNDADYFSGYLSDMELRIDQRYLANDLTPDAMSKIGAQMQDSMGSFMGVLVGVALAIYVVLMYLLTKTIIERSARSISYMKVFGYRDAEINKLYLLSIAEVVIASLLIAVPVVFCLIDALVQVVFMQYNGYFVLTLPMDKIALEVALGVVCFTVVAFFHSRRIKQVPLALALKIQE